MRAAGLGFRRAARAAIVQRHRTRIERAGDGWALESRGSFARAFRWRRGRRGDERGRDREGCECAGRSGSAVGPVVEVSNVLSAYLRDGVRLRLERPLSAVEGGVGSEPSWLAICRPRRLRHRTSQSLAAIPVARCCAGHAALAGFLMLGRSGRGRYGLGSYSEHVRRLD